MYDDFYKLTGHPFQLTPNPNFFYGSSGHQRAMAYLQYGLHQGEGFIVVTGDIGAGKTTLIGHVLGQLDSSRYVTAKLATTQLGAQDTLRMLASALGIEIRGSDKALLLRSVEHFLLDNQRQNRRVLIIVDEVQNLPLKSLEELRMLSNFQSGDRASVQFCLLGQPQFRDALATADLEQLRQRVVVSYHLGPLQAAETRAYIEHRLHHVGWANDPEITDEAYLRVFRFSAGVPRRINMLCDRLLLYGMLEGLHRIDDKVVDTVAAEMSSEGTRMVAPPPPVAAPREPPPLHQANGAGADVEGRLASLETLVRAHDRTIKRGIELAASYFNGGLAQIPPDALHQSALGEGES